MAGTRLQAGPATRAAAARPVVTVRSRFPPYHPTARPKEYTVPICKQDQIFTLAAAAESGY